MLGNLRVDGRGPTHCWPCFGDQRRQDSISITIKATNITLTAVMSAVNPGGISIAAVTTTITMVTTTTASTITMVTVTTRSITVVTHPTPGLDILHLALQIHSPLILCLGRLTFMDCIKELLPSPSGGFSQWGSAGGEWGGGRNRKWRRGRKGRNTLREVRIERNQL